MRSSVAAGHDREGARGIIVRGRREAALRQGLSIRVDIRTPTGSIQMLRAYSYFRSSAAYRVRIALALKGLSYEYVAVDLAKGEHEESGYGAVAANRLVPSLVDGEVTLTQSLAIIEYLEEQHPHPPLLPQGSGARASVRALAYDIACEIHPLNNVRVLRYLRREMKVTSEDKDRWTRHWIESGLGVIERRLAADRTRGSFCHGDDPTMADVVLVPQIFNAHRSECDLSACPLVMSVFDRCMALDAFAGTQPSACPDAVS
jgi:maleylacetoacetate isomerase/maleylpyruvate isomerase